MRVTTLFINSVFCWSRKMATIFILASEVSLRSISLFAPDVFIISGLRSSGAYDAFSTFFHRQYCLLVTKDGHNDYLSVERFLLTSLSEFALATSWFLVYESLKSIVRVTTLFIISVVCWSTKIVTIFVLASEGSLTSFSLFAFSIFLNSGSHSSDAWTEFYHFIDHYCCLLVTKDGHNDYLSVESFSLTSLSEFASSKFVISSLRSFGADNVFHHFMHRQFRWHRSRCLLLAFSWFLAYKTP